MLPHRYFSLWLVLISLSSSCLRQGALPDEDLVQYVNPFIGTGGHGHTYPGATLPFGMVQLSPDTRLDGWDGCSGYHFTDSVVYGFSHTHLNGTGVSDYGDILFMPFTGSPTFRQQDYAAAFEKTSERATPGYYTVRLRDSGILAELTASLRTGVHRYTFPEGKPAGLLLDLVHRDLVLDAGISIKSNTEIEGFRRSRAWADDQHVYFAARFSRPFQTHELDPTDPKAAFRFDASPEPLVVQVAISAVDQEGAWKNLRAEDARHDFDRVHREALNIWNQQLRKIRVEGTDKTIFYTALYHTMLQPNTFTDTDGRYRGMDQQIHRAEDYCHYTVFSLWDTYRAAHPLYNIIEPKRSRDFIRTFLSQYRQQGFLPVWELAGNETYCMIGYHAASVITDAWVKGIRDYDARLALEAMKATATKDHFGKIPFREYGFVPAELDAESVSKTLEYAYDDWCIAQFALAQGDTATHREFLSSAQAYQNLFDADTGFFRARRNQSWIQPFDPAEVNFHFTEANAWQYGFYVPHDIAGWIALIGGKDQASRQLDALFSADSQTTGREQADITGLIGQYAHGNEPSHHIAYLYNYTGQPWKTQARVREIMQTQYANQPDGLSGNEDCGQMSAWYVFSALGFYPVCPGSSDYAIGSPAVEQAAITLADGKQFRILVRNAGADKVYVQSLTLNGKPLTRNFLRHQEIMAGGLLEFTMSSQPNTAPTEAPDSRIDQHRQLPLPVVARGQRAFFDQDTIVLSHPADDATIYYSLNEGDPQPYRKPIIIRETTRLDAWAERSSFGESRKIRAVFRKIPGGRSLSLRYPYAPQYAASGPHALIDFLEGGTDFRTGEWQGFEGTDLDATVDLGKVQPVSAIQIRFLQDENAWIFMPQRVSFYTAIQEQQFTLVKTLDSRTLAEAKGSLTELFSVSLGESARYVRVLASNRGVCPPWHKGAGGKAWIFADEIHIRSSAE
jgi:predicted alpha-1,2-mannosidase